MHTSSFLWECTICDGVLASQQLLSRQYRTSDHQMNATRTLLYWTVVLLESTPRSLDHPFTRSIFVPPLLRFGPFTFQQIPPMGLIRVLQCQTSGQVVVSGQKCNGLYQQNVYQPNQINSPLNFRENSYQNCGKLANSWDSPWSCLPDVHGFRWQLWQMWLYLVHTVLLHKKTTNRRLQPSSRRHSDPGVPS